MRLYLSGPMRMYKDLNYNFGAFFIAAALLRMKGHEVVNPAEMDIEGGQAHWSPGDGRVVLSKDFAVEDALKRDYIAIVENEVEGIVLLDGWEESEGAKRELAFAKFLGLKVFEYLENGENGETGEIQPVSEGVSHVS